jgi:hypothetical protein
MMENRVWFECVREYELGEEVKKIYRIEIDEPCEDGYIHILELTVNDCEKLLIEFWGNKLIVEWKRRPNVFVAFNLVARLEYKDTFEEIPWWVDPEELNDTINISGVKKTFEMILDYLKTIFTEPFQSSL